MGPVSAGLEESVGVVPSVAPESEGVVLLLHAMMQQGRIATIE
jgi:hypothetical protein